MEGLLRASLLLSALLLVVSTVVSGQIVPINSSAPNGPIRLWRNGSTSLSYTSGRVQLVYNRQWGNICDDVEFGLTEAIVICHQLGYTGASSQSRAALDMFGTDSNPTLLSGMSCSTSSYLVILQCNYNNTPSSSCTDNYDVSVTCYVSRIWDNPFWGQLRLTNGSSVNSGVVRVYCGRVDWGVICRDSYEQDDADTICRQLGYHSAYRINFPIPPLYRRSLFLWNDGNGCSSQQSCLANCRQCLTASAHRSCTTNEYVTVECYSPQQYTGTTTQTCVNASCLHKEYSAHIYNNGPIRLWRNGASSLSYTSGRVHVLIDRIWGNIRGDGKFELTEATVICHQLGYTGASSQSRARVDRFGSDSSLQVIANVDCSTDTFLVILQCNHEVILLSPASACAPGDGDNDDVSVTCYSNRIWDNPYTGQVRLTGGSTVNQGLVEVYCNSQWGTVYVQDSALRRVFAETICRQLGYYGADYDLLSISSNAGIYYFRNPCSTSRSCLQHCASCPRSTSTFAFGSPSPLTLRCRTDYPTTSNYTATNITTCDGRSLQPSYPTFMVTPTPTINSVLLTVGISLGTVLLICCAISFPIVWMCFCGGSCPGSSSIQSENSHRNTSGARYPRQTPVVVDLTQPPHAFDLVPQTEPPESTITNSQPSNPITTQPMPSDGTLTEVPPPAYDLQDDYTTYNEDMNKPADPPPPYQSTTVPSSPPLYSASDVFIHHPTSGGNNVQHVPDLSHTPNTHTPDPSHVPQPDPAQMRDTEV